MATYQNIGESKLVSMTNVTGASFQAPKPDAKVSGFARLTGDVDGQRQTIKYVTIFAGDKDAFCDNLDECLSDPTATVELGLQEQFNAETGQPRLSAHYSAPEAINVKSFRDNLM